MSKRKDECFMCSSRRCYFRVTCFDHGFDEVACRKHRDDLYKHSDVALPGIVKTFTTSTGLLRRELTGNAKPGLRRVEVSNASR